MSEMMKNATATEPTQDIAVVGEGRVEQPSNRDYAGKLLMVMNGALVGVPSAYAVSDSLVVTAMAAALAGVSAAALLAAPGTRPRR